ncbi:MAG: UDP-N-acetylmuramate--L-alanine ligase [Oscillospiraceae bacterium]|jgi:UDP-N-acetylmuramate--alanine ligase|nr:UDP-N-acetylmuramate--L-alanine ligase [Oscillospiraceae bacterium]
MTEAKLENMIRTGARAHLIGIGGVSMSPLAQVLTRSGVIVTGSDVKKSAAIDALERDGITVFIGHSRKNVSGAEFIIRTAAARDDNPEVLEARALGIPVFERADAWGLIMRGYKNAVCIAGSHGKTTTTSMIAQILLTANADPTVMIGGTLPAIGSGYRVGGGDTIVLESCEYYNSFHKFFPTLSVILNVDADHLDFFGSLEAVKASFREFALKTSDTGKVIINGDDENTLDAIAGIARETISFGTAPSCDVFCEGLSVTSGGSRFDVLADERVYARISLRVPGRHNVLNALAACAAAWTLGVPGEVVEDALSRFSGAERRFEFKGKINGADIYDDYAHHPTELRSLIDAAGSLPYKRVLIAFQPHTYSRTYSHFSDFARELSRVDKVYLAEIYSARELNTVGVTSRDLASAIPGAVYCPSFDDIVRHITREARPGDLVLTVGAGELDTVGERLAKIGEASAV